MTLVEAARRYLGVPFQHQGRNPAVGLDCVGLLAVSLRDAGMGHYLAHDRLGYSRDPHDGLLEKALAAAFGPPLPRSEMRPGDIVAMRFRGPVRHVAIVTDNPEGLYLIHSYTSILRVTEHRIDAKWARRIVGVYRPEAAHVG